MYSKYSINMIAWQYMFPQNFRKNDIMRKGAQSLRSRMRYTSSMSSPSRTTCASLSYCSSR